MEREKEKRHLHNQVDLSEVENPVFPIVEIQTRERTKNVVTGLPDYVVDAVLVVLGTCVRGLGHKDLSCELVEGENCRGHYGWFFSCPHCGASMSFYYPPF